VVDGSMGFLELPSLCFCGVIYLDFPRPYQGTPRNSQTQEKELEQINKLVDGWLGLGFCGCAGGGGGADFLVAAPRRLTSCEVGATGRRALLVARETAVVRGVPHSRRAVCSLFHFFGLYSSDFGSDQHQGAGGRSSGCAVLLNAAANVTRWGVVGFCAEDDQLTDST
jgi:hypothetical protein